VVIRVADNPAEQRYEVFVEGDLGGFIEYTLSGKRITMYHTEVEPAYKGQGVGSEFARAALDDVRRRGLELVPLCPFIAEYIREHPDDYLDLVAAPMREKVLTDG
jgi:uncharacterized protein